MSDQNDNDWGRYLGMGLEIAVGAGLGYLVGSWLDRKFDWHGNGAVVGVMVGVAAGMYLLIRDAIKMNKD